MRKLLYFVLLTFFVSSCTSAHLIKGYSKDEQYGYIADMSIRIGKSDSRLQRFFHELSGPKGEKITYQSLPALGYRTTQKALINQRKKVKYSVTYEGLDKPIILYINMYDKGKLMVPTGFKLKE